MVSRIETKVEIRVDKRCGCSSPPDARSRAGIGRPWRWAPEPLYTERV